MTEQQQALPSRVLAQIAYAQELEHFIDDTAKRMAETFGYQKANCMAKLANVLSDADKQIFEAYRRLNRGH